MSDYVFYFINILKSVSDNLNCIQIVASYLFCKGFQPSKKHISLTMRCAGDDDLLLSWSCEKQLVLNLSLLFYLLGKSVLFEQVYYLHQFYSYNN